MFNEHTVHSFIAGDGREEGREVGSVIVTHKKIKIMKNDIGAGESEKEQWN